MVASSASSGMHVTRRLRFLGSGPQPFQTPRAKRKRRTAPHSKGFATCCARAHLAQRMECDVTRRLRFLGSDPEPPKRQEQNESGGRRRTPRASPPAVPEPISRSAWSATSPVAFVFFGRIPNPSKRQEQNESGGRRRT